jgi:hypothetical protein
MYLLNSVGYMRLSTECSFFLLPQSLKLHTSSANREGGDRISVLSACLMGKLSQSTPCHKLSQQRQMFLSHQVLRSSEKGVLCAILKCSGRCQGSLPSQARELACEIVD